MKAKNFKLKRIALALAGRAHDALFGYMARTGLVACALPLIVEKIDDVPEAQRSLYVEKDGKFRLDVDGIEDTSGLKSALEKERETARNADKARKELEKRYSGIDPDKVRALMSRLETDEEAKLIAEGKLDEVVNKRTEKLRSDIQRQVDEANGKVSAADARAKKFEQRVLDNHIRAAAAKVGLHAHAIEDALFRGRNMFSLNDDGDAIQPGEDGKPVLGKDGKTPFGPAEWLESMKEQAPHWFPAGSSGGGAGGGSQGAGGAKTITRAAFNALDASEKAKIAKTHKITD